MNIIAACISSPPFGESINREGEWNKSIDPQKNSYPQNRSKEYLERNQILYGSTPGNLGNMKAGSIEEITNVMNNTTSITRTDWTGLYKNGWQNEIVPEAFAHPAKFSRALIRHIYDHAIAEKWLTEGDCVIDPFGGVALGGLDAMRLGLSWTGVELEPRFVDLGGQNIAAWNKRYQGKLPRWGRARLLQGDSRELVKIVQATGACVSSPPFVQSEGGKDAGIVKQGHEGKGPFAGRSAIAYGFNGRSQLSTPGQLGAMRAGSYDAAVKVYGIDKNPLTHYNDGRKEPDNGKENTTISGGSLSPLSIRDVDGGNRREIRSETDGGSEQTQEGGLSDTQLIRSPQGSIQDGQTQTTQHERPGSLGMEGWQRSPGVSTTGTKGSLRDLREPSELGDTSQRLQSLQQQPGELTGSLCELSYEPSQEIILGSDKEREGAAQEQRTSGVDGVISSPPYTSDALGHKRGEAGAKREATGQYKQGYTQGEVTREYYSDTPDNLGNSTGDTFWLSARQIVDQVYSILRPGGAAIWVVKAYVKNKQIVPFPDQWRQMCEAAGFVTLHEHRAWLVEDRGTQIDLEGNHHTKTIQRKSFFRRLAEAKGSPRIDFETVLCMVKPGGEGVELGEAQSQAACISSPPFISGSEGVMRADKFSDPAAFAREQMNKGHGSSFEAKLKAMVMDNDRYQYGSTPGNLGNMKAGDFEEAKKA